MSCDMDIEANDLMQKLTAGVDFVFPSFDPNNPELQLPGGSSNPLYNVPSKLEITDVTTRERGGSGSFDALCDAVLSQLHAEYKTGKITGGEYTKAFIASMEAAMGNSVQFALNKDTVYWQSIAAQLSALQTRMQIELLKQQISAAKVQAQVAEAEYALTKAKLATESATYCTAQYNLANILPAQKLLLESQAQTEAINRDIASYNLTQMLPTQKEHLLEQIESQRANTLDVRKDGTPVTGTVGKQKELYAQQITSYKRNDESRVAKMFLDSWISQKTIDEDLLAPSSLQNASVDEVMIAVKSKSGLI